MATIIKISAKDNPEKVRKALAKLQKKQRKKLIDFYGKMPTLYGDAIAYQKKTRNEW